MGEITLAGFVGTDDCAACKHGLVSGVVHGWHGVVVHNCCCADCVAGYEEATGVRPIPVWRKEVTCSCPHCTGLRAQRRAASLLGKRRRVEPGDAIRSVASELFDPNGFFVYLLWGDDPDRPIYVGQSRDVLSRMGTGTRRFAVKNVQWIRRESKEAMDELERSLIRLYQPPENKIMYDTC
jgi:hypothetical protein